MDFFLQIQPPTATAQEKQVRVVHGKPLFYDPAPVKAAKKLLSGDTVRFEDVIANAEYFAFRNTSNSWFCTCNYSYFITCNNRFIFTIIVNGNCKSILTCRQRAAD